MIFHSQLMFKLSAICCNTCAETRTPLLDWRINDAFIKVVPHLHDALSQFLNTTDFRSENKVLHNTRLFRLFVFFISQISRVNVDNVVNGSHCPFAAATRAFCSRSASVKLSYNFFNPPNDHPFWGNSLRNILVPYCLCCLLILFGNLFLFTERHFCKQLSVKRKYAKHCLMIKM